MNRWSWRIIAVGLCIGGIAQAGIADLDTPADAPAPIIAKPVKKHPKKHSKSVNAKTADETPKVMSLSNDDLPKRHNYYATQDASNSQPVPVPTNTQPVPRSAQSAATPAAAAPLDPYAGVAPRIAPSSDPSAVPTPDASAVHSTTDLNKPIPLNKNSGF